MTSTPTDPAAIDLEAIKSWSAQVAPIIPALIAAVEALRERVASLTADVKAADAHVVELETEAWNSTKAAKARVAELEKNLAETEAESEHYLRLAIVDPGANDQVSWKDHAKATDALTVELVRTLVNIESQLREVFMQDDWEADCLSIFEKIRTALAATPAKAMERARAVEAVVKAAQFFMEDGIAEDSPDLNQVAWGILDEALTKLDALGKERE